MALQYSCFRTRSRDGTLRPLSCAFSLASEGVPIVPIVLDGTHDALPKTGMTIHTRKRATLSVRVLPPIMPEDFPESTQELSDRVREDMRHILSNLRANTP